MHSSRGIFSPSPSASACGPSERSCRLLPTATNAPNAVANFIMQTFVDQDLLNPSVSSQKRLHKKKRFIPTPNSYFMDVKCPGCFASFISPLSDGSRPWTIFWGCRLFSCATPSLALSLFSAGHHHCLLLRPDCCCLQQLLHRRRHPHWRKVPSH